MHAYAQVATNALHTPSISTTNVTDLLENLEPANTVPDVPPHGVPQCLSLVLSLSLSCELFPLPFS